VVVVEDARKCARRSGSTPRKGGTAMHTPPAAPSFIELLGVERERLKRINLTPSRLPSTPIIRRRNGSATISLLRLSLRLPAHRTRTALPSIDTAYHQTTASPPAPSSISISISITTPGRAPPNPLTSLRPLGWNTQRCPQKENLAHEEAAPTNGSREAFEGRHRVE
jgi:hypothetical protein